MLDRSSTRLARGMLNSLVRTISCNGVDGTVPAILDIDDSNIGVVGEPAIPEASMTVPLAISQLPEL